MTLDIASTGRFWRVFITTAALIQAYGKHVTWIALQPALVKAKYTAMTVDSTTWQAQDEPPAGTLAWVRMAAHTGAKKAAERIATTGSPYSHSNKKKTLPSRFSKVFAKSTVKNIRMNDVTQTKNALPAFPK